MELQNTRLLSTKLFIPKPRINLVVRPRLFERLERCLDYTLTLICAPPGYGKTTLLTSCIAGRKQSAAASSTTLPPLEQPAFSWISLDADDNDPVRFLSYLLAGLEKIKPGISAGALPLLNSFPSAPIQNILTELINQLNDLPAPVILVLDDYQFISNPVVHEGVTFFLEHPPSNIHLVISTRSDPPIPLSRLRARNQLLEIRASELRFTPDEVDHFLNQVMHLSLTPDDIASLEERTEGWIAGLQMAALSMQGREDTARFIQTFSGSHHYILDYLAEETLNRQPPAVQDFLLKTSVLERVCSDLCAALLDGSAATHQEILEYLERSNLFLVALDEERRWYRYHHLFADLLRARLLQAQSEAVVELNLCASQWYEKNEYLAEAVLHAFAARDNERAADLIEHYATARWAQGDPILIRMATRLPPEILHRRPAPCICLAWVLISRGEVPAGIALLDGLMTEMNANPSEAVEWVSAFADLLYAYATPFPGEQDQKPIPRYRTLKLIPEQETGLRETANYLYAVLLGRLGRFEHAANILDCCSHRDVNTTGPIAVFWMVGLLARVRIMQGRLPDAAELCREYLANFAEKRKSPFFSAGSLNIILGEVLYEWNQLDEAEQQICEGIRANEHWHNIMFDGIGYSDLISVKLAKGDRSGALHTLAQLDQILQGRTLPVDLEEELWTYRARVWLATGDLTSAVEWADRVSANAPQAFLQEWSRISVARVRIAQGRFREAQEVLEAVNNLPGADQRVHRQVRVEMVLAIALFRQNLFPPAFAAFERCLALGEPGGYLRAFLDSGEPVRELLTAYLHRSAPAHAAYAQRLLAAFTQAREASGSEQANAELVEPLTARELEILRLMAAGQSNRQIAETLILAEGTVKFYVHAVLEKLGVHSRTQAIAAAREHRLI